MIVNIILKTQPGHGIKMIIIEFIKEYIESIRCKRKIRAIYGGDPPNHKSCEDVKNGVPDLDRIKCKNQQEI